jgi:uncharacterized membrane protein
MIQDILILISITFLPFLELRASIPYGILQTDLHWSLVLIICVITNMILGPLIYFFLDKVVHWFFFMTWFKNLYEKKVEKTQNKIRPYVQKYGKWALALFIAVPLPGSGSYTGALAAYLMGMRYKRFMLVNAVGVTLAGIAVTLIVLAGNGAWHWLVKII